MPTNYGYTPITFSYKQYIYPMCGIAGIISPNTSIITTRTLKQMATALAHRGPDGEGFFINTNHTVGLAHTRLAIIDLTTAAAQPMHYLGRYSIVYNGEIYNFKALKKTLQSVGYSFVSKSDTEVILAAYDYYKEDCVTHFDGMFAFAIWDEVQQSIFCARDIFGEKPFYYCIENDMFLFASEMKALWAIGLPKAVDEKMMVNYLALGTLQNANDSGQTFFRDIKSLPPAQYALLYVRDMKLSITNFNSIDKDYTTTLSEAAAVEQLDYLLEQAIITRLQSDVSVGTSLSGGLDSSTIAYYMSKQKTVNFKTFSACFDGFTKDESTLIKELCMLYNVNNYSIHPLADGLVDDFEKICYHQEEPIASSSIYAQYKVYELAKLHNVKVVLDGQGADEILAGYNKYLHWYLQELICNNKFASAKKLYSDFKKNGIVIPFGIKNIIAGYFPLHVALILEKQAYNKIANNKDITNHLKFAVKGQEWEGIAKPVVNKLNDVLYHSTVTNGLQELLRYADRNSMAHGVEVRLPYLKLSLVSFLFSLPAQLKISNGYTKYILRKVMSNRLPKSIVHNPIKTGFETPQQMWMQNDKVQQLINDAKQTLVNKQILNPSILHKKIEAKHVHQADNADWRYLSLAGILK